MFCVKFGLYSYDLSGVMPSTGGGCRVLVAGDAATDVDSGRGGYLGFLQDDIPREIFSG